MKLIRETVENVNYLTETTESGKKRLFIEGTFLVGDQVNRITNSILRLIGH